jgi:curved DNA-binding protein CbpA
MFVDYYLLLDLSLSASSEDIKVAFKKQALRWHPDRNPNIDTTAKMQLLNEAKLILLDSEARGLYDIQYRKYIAAEEEKRQSKQKEYAREKNYNDWQKRASDNIYDEPFIHPDFDVDDDILKRWMANAKKQAVELAKQTIEELKGMTIAGVKEGTKVMGTALIAQIVLGIIIFLVVVLTKTCK